MANDDQARRIKVSFQQTAQDLIEHGPTVTIGIAGTPYTPGQPIRTVLALFDSGSAGTAISLRLAELLKLQLIDSRIVQELGRQPLTADFFPVRLFVPQLHFDTDAAALPFAPPHDVIVGRDILAHCKLSIDFATGITALYFMPTP